MEKKPTDVLEDEHRYILKVVGTMTVLATVSIRETE
jgi:hypothetical protein